MSQESQAFGRGLSPGTARGSPARKAAVASGAGSVGWMSRGACRQADPELFFPVAAVTGPGARQAEAAKAVCGPCVVRADCLSYALEVMPEGIWGATTEEERRAARASSVRRARLLAARRPVPPGRTG
jgi:WhiB family redox-sensing transcriptional regulator